MIKKAFKFLSNNDVTKFILKSKELLDNEGKSIELNDKVK
jgi:hypothetical protein